MFCQAKSFHYTVVVRGGFFTSRCRVLLLAGARLVPAATGLYRKAGMSYKGINNSFGWR